MKAKDIATLLAGKADEVARYLLPNGKRVSGEWRVGSADGESGQSLGIPLTGDKVGMWYDFQAGEGGDLLDLWCAVNRQSISDAMRDAKDWLGVTEPVFVGQMKKKYTKPEKPAAQKPKSAVLEYLTNERKLNAYTLDAYKIAEQGENIVFPFLRDGELIRYKTRHIADKHKVFSSGDEPALFGWQAIPEDARSVVICEGEIDALTWLQFGYPALSLPNGAKALNWIENEYQHLERFDEIYLSMDMDSAGQSAVDEICERLGRERVRVVKLPHKDANECLQKGLCGEDIEPCIKQARTNDPSELRQAYDYKDQIEELFLDDSINGLFTPWDKLTNQLRFRKGEVVLLGGLNGHGKTQAMGHIAVDICAQGEKVCCASLEMPPRKYLKNMLHQMTGFGQPGDKVRHQAYEWMQDKLYVFDVVGRTKLEKLFSVFEYAYRRYGIDVFVIDNFSKLGISFDDQEKQQFFMDALTDFAKSHNVLVFLVAHLRKPMDESKPLGKMDVKGSGVLTDLVDTVIIWHRNKRKEKEIKAGDADEETMSQPDAFMICEKQREEGIEPRLGLFFDRESRQFIQSGERVKRYVKFKDENIVQI